MNNQRMAELLGINPRSDRAVRGIMKYPGNKTDLLPDILPLLPYCKTYVEVFGGSGIILLNRSKSPCEVYNDRYGGVVDFYRTLRDNVNELIDRLSLYLHSREEWELCKKTWDSPDLSACERAARWYYWLQLSIMAKGDAWAHNIPSAIQSPKITLIDNKIPYFRQIHYRLKKVQIENLDWRDCIRKYDSFDTVFYLDPPYFNSDPAVYDLHMKETEHIQLLELIQSSQGFFALSGYPNPLYAKYPWDQVHTFTRQNRLAVIQKKDVTKTKVTECLWIKEQRHES